MVMDDLETLIEEAKKEKHGYTPAIFDLSLEKDRVQVKGFLKYGVIRSVSDDYEEQIRELFGVNNPTLVYAPDFKERFASHWEETLKTAPLFQQGKWVYYPWHAALVHVLPEEDYWKVRTARNKNLINAEEQSKFYNATLGLGGLSVGSSIAYALTLQGGPKHIKLADMDRLALSNTNRVLAGSENLGLLKVEMAARRIYEINPYADVEIFPEGLSKENIGTFFEGLDIVVDELDNIAVKYLIREQAKKHKIAVVMGADNGDNAVIDIERYDLTPDMPFFHGRLGDVTYESLTNLDKFGIGKTITKHIGPENVTVRMQESLLEMGKTIVSWPQLGGAALINGAAVAYCVRKILNGEPLEGNRAVISLDEKLVPDYFSPVESEKRTQAADVFKKTFGL
jgi:hypothetical protein